MTSRPAPLKAVVAVAVLVVLCSAAFACQASRTAGPSDLSSSPAGPGVPVLVALDDPVGPTGVEHGVPVGWRHDELGAQAAAAGFVRASRLVATAGPLSRRDVIATLATTDYGPALVESTGRQLDDLLFSLGQRDLQPHDLVWSEHPLTLTSTTLASDVVEVRVWSVLIIGAEGGSAARQVWRTSAMTMRWTDGDWKVDHWSSSPGPLPSPPSEAEVSPLAEVVEVTAWPPAPVGGGS